MTSQQQQRRADELIQFCERQIGDSECGPYWQQQFQDIAALLRELSTDAPALQRSSKAGGTNG